MKESAFSIDINKPVHVYFIGIGGVSMSGLAHILHDRGFPVSGSDRAPSDMTQMLTEQGITVHFGQKAENITDAPTPIDVVVYTAAVHPDNPEYMAAEQARIPMLSRAELLGQMMRRYDTPIAVSGTHGKTTTTSMLSEIFMTADMDPTLLIGGVYSGIGSNTRIGKSGLLVTEACEYTNSFLSFFPKYACILNVEADHMDFFKNLDEIYDSFHSFAHLIPKDGALVIGSNIDVFKRLTNDLSCRIITFGEKESDDVYASDISYDTNGLPTFTLHADALGAQAVSVSLKVPGHHNVLNALAAFALARLAGAETELIVTGLERFSGAHRRFEHKGVRNGITVVDDYAHHPTEIAATLAAADRVPHNKLWCVFQPHTYTRTKVFLHAFASSLKGADHVILLPIYAAREQDIYGVSSKDLCEEINRMGGQCTYIDSFENVKQFILQNCTNDDLLITMGAGDVVKIAEDLVS